MHAAPAIAVIGAALPLAAVMAACSQPRADGADAPAPAETAAGSACATLAADHPRARGARFSAVSTVQGVSFAVQAGSQACATDDGGDAVCEVDGGGVVRVSGRQGPIAYFDIPAGRNARVSMSHDIARCVLN